MVATLPQTPSRVFQTKIETSGTDRKNTHDPADIRAHFEKFKAAREIFGIQTEDMYNYDETGFRVGIGRAHEVITRLKNRRLYVSDPDNRESVTSVETICADGTAIDPFIILPGVNHLHKAFRDLFGKTLVGVSETGYSNDDLNLEYARHFNKCTINKRIGKYCMLISDGYNSHLEFDFVEYCWNNFIVPFCLPPHTTHFLQPLDVVCFQPLKHYHAEAIDRAVRTGDSDFSKYEFLAAFNDVRAQAFTESTILSAFRKTGLMPYNPELVVGAMQELVREEATPEPDKGIEQELDLLQTPHKHLEVRKFAQQLSDELDEAEISPGLRMKVRKFMKGSLARVEAGAQAENDYSHTKVAENARAARKKASSKVVQKGGVIYADQARKRIKFREEGDAEADAKRIALLRKRQKQPFLDWFELCAVAARNRIRRLKTQTDYGMEY